MNDKDKDVTHFARKTIKATEEPEPQEPKEKEQEVDDREHPVEGQIRFIDEIRKIKETNQIKDQSRGANFPRFNDALPKCYRRNPCFFLRVLIGIYEKSTTMPEATAAKEVLIREGNVREVVSPVTVCGDIHGQFGDLLELFKVAGPCIIVSYIFQGDYVDRGHDSVETISLLLCYKLNFPEQITILRGNHESRSITQVYGFYDECFQKYGSSDVWRSITDVFDYLPLIALVDGRTLCLHGGLSPSISVLDDLRKIDRLREIPKKGGMADIVWSDPVEELGFNPSPRGSGFHFGPDMTQLFCHFNGLDLISRAHQLVDGGYQYTHDAQLITIFSAPNYCYRCGNKAAVMTIDNCQPVNNLLQFDVAPGQQAHREKHMPDFF